MEASGLLLAKPLTSQGINEEGSSWHGLYMDVLGSSFGFMCRSHRLFKSRTESLAFSIVNNGDDAKCAVKQKLL